MAHHPIHRHNLQADNGRNLSSRPSKERKASKIFVLGVYYNIQKPKKSSRAACSQTQASAVTELMVGITAFSSHQTSQKNAMTALLVPEGVSMTARDVLTFKYLGSDYQHKKHFFFKEKTNMLTHCRLPN